MRSGRRVRASASPTTLRAPRGPRYRFRTRADDAPDPIDNEVDAVDASALLRDDDALPALDREALRGARRPRGIGGDPEVTLRSGEVPALPQNMRPRVRMRGRRMEVDREVDDLIVIGSDAGAGGDGGGNVRGAVEADAAAGSAAGNAVADASAVADVDGAAFVDGRAPSPVDADSQSTVDEPGPEIMNGGAGVEPVGRRVPAGGRDALSMVVEAMRSGPDDGGHNLDSVEPNVADIAEAASPGNEPGCEDSLLAGERTTQTPMWPVDGVAEDAGYTTDEEPPYYLRVEMRRREKLAEQAAAFARAAAVVQAERHLLASLLVYPMPCPIVEDDRSDVNNEEEDNGGADHGGEREGGDDDVVMVGEGENDGAKEGVRKLFRREPVALSRKRLNAVARFRAKKKRLQDSSPVPKALPAEPLLWKTRSDARALPFAPPKRTGTTFNVERLAAIRNFHRRRGNVVAKSAVAKKANPSAAMAHSMLIWTTGDKRVVCKCKACAPKSLASAVAYQMPDELFNPGWSKVDDEARSVKLESF